MASAARSITARALGVVGSVTGCSSPQSSTSTMMVPASAASLLFRSSAWVMCGSSTPLQAIEWYRIGVRIGSEHTLQQKDDESEHSYPLPPVVFRYRVGSGLPFRPLTQLTSDLLEHLECLIALQGRGKSCCTFIADIVAINTAKEAQTVSTSKSATTPSFPATASVADYVCGPCSAPVAWRDY